MGFEDYISEAEAVNYAGVSVATLKRFAEAGYLELETDSDGLRLFSKRELESLFNLQPQSLVFTSNSMPEDSEAAAEVVPDTLSRKTQQTVVYELNPSDFRVKPRRHTEPEIQAEPVRPALQVQAAEAKIESKNDPLPAQPQQQEVKPQIAVSDEAAAALRVELTSAERELTKFKNIAEIQEKILDLKDKELDQLRQERDWLRSRIERFEEKQDRDQLLLLAETQTIRQLISVQQKRSPLRAALEWFGLAQEQQVQGSTIEINKMQK